jgi:hypothetical protein
MSNGVPIRGLTGMEGESAECILECMDFYGVEKAFLFTPILDIQPTRWRKLTAACNDIAPCSLVL